MKKSARAWALVGQAQGLGTAEAYDCWSRRVVLRQLFSRLLHARDPVLHRAVFGTFPWDGTLDAVGSWGGGIFEPLSPDRRPLTPAVLHEIRARLPGGDAPHLLGTVYESMLDESVHMVKGKPELVSRNGRRKGGRHYTPSPLAKQVFADALVMHGHGGVLNVLDPAMGCGVFLLAALDAFESPDGPPLEAVAQRHLWGIDCDAEAVETARLMLWLRVSAHGAPGKFMVERLRVADALLDEPVCADMDLVIGNPPYIPFYGRGSQRSFFPETYRDTLRSRHGHIDGQAVISGRLNTFLPFCAYATARCRNTGMVSVVLPDAVLTNASYAPLREALTRTGRLRKIRRYTQPLFSNAAVGTAVVSWGGRRQQGHVMMQDAEKPPVTVALSALSERLKTNWMPLSEREWGRCLLQGDQFVPLEQVATVRDGINTGSRRMRLALITGEDDGDPSLKPCLEGKNIHPYAVTPAVLWVRMNPALLANGREGASLGSMAFFSRPKIICRQTAAHPIAAVDLQGHPYRNSAHGIALHEQDDTVLWALCAWLNAKPLHRHYQTVTGEVRRTFPQVHVASLRQLPVPKRLLNTEDTVVQALSALARQAASGDDVVSAMHEQIEALLTP